MSLSISNTFASVVLEALGKQRAELVLQSPWDVMRDLGVYEDPTTIVITRYSVGNEQRLQVQQLFGTPPLSTQPRDLSQFRFPKEFLPVFPNGWADVAAREGFELAKDEPPKDIRDK